LVLLDLLLCCRLRLTGRGLFGHGYDLAGLYDNFLV
jgi:hypothetical protein